jgi:hypothetical protein
MRTFRLSDHRHNEKADMYQRRLAIAWQTCGMLSVMYQVFIANKYKLFDQASPICASMWLMMQDMAEDQLQQYSLQWRFELQVPSCVSHPLLNLFYFYVILRLLMFDCPVQSSGLQCA